MGAPPDLVVSHQCKELFDLVDSGGRGRRVVHMPARPLGEPVLSQFGFVAGGVVRHDMDVEVPRDIALDRVKEAAELLRGGATYICL